jgi:hypothetical protein
MTLWFVVNNVVYDIGFARDRAKIEATFRMWAIFVQDI